MTETKTEYRVVYRQGVRAETQEGFPKPDINHGGWAYYNNVGFPQVIRWEKRTVTTSNWEEA